MCAQQCSLAHSELHRAMVLVVLVLLALLSSFHGRPGFKKKYFLKVGPHLRRKGLNSEDR
jgi:hypothetical protein